MDFGSFLLRELCKHQQEVKILEKLIFFLSCIGKPVLGNWGRNQQCGAEINLKRWAWGEDWVIASLPSPLAMTLAAHSSQHRSWSEFTHGKKLLLLACTVLVNS